MTRGPVISRAAASTDVLADLTKYYVVARGRRPGAYNFDWKQVTAQVMGVKSSLHEAFHTPQEARDYVRKYRDYHEGVKQKVVRLLLNKDFQTKERQVVTQRTTKTELGTN